MGREERIPRRNRAGSKKIRPMAARRSFFGESSRLVPKSGKERFRVFRAPPERKRNSVDESKRARQSPFPFRRNAVLQKAAYSRIPFAATAFRLKEEQIPPLTNIPGEISLSPDAAAKAQTSVAKRHKTQRISLSPPRRKKTFSTNDKVSRKMDGTSEFPRRRPLLSFLYPPFAGKSSFSRF